MSSRPGPVSSQRVRFPGGAGSELGGIIDLPKASPKAFGVFAPCFTCRKDAKAIVRISRALAEDGIAVLRYDVTGIGDSDGDFARTTFATQVADVGAAIDFLEDSSGPPTLVLGISLGGAVALVGTQHHPGIEAVAVVNAPAELKHLRAMLLRLAPELEHPGAATEVTLLGQKTRIGSELVADLGRESVIDAAANLSRPLLVAASTDDEIVPAAGGEVLFAAASHPKSFLAVSGADHLMLRRPEAASWLGRMISGWFEGVGWRSKAP